MSFSLGKLAAVRPHGLSDFTTYVKGKLPTPPAAVTYGGSYGVAGWGLNGNGTYGDCTMAGANHLLMAWNSEVSINVPIPSDAEIESQYFTLTGGPDSGLDENTVLSTWASGGLFGGPKIAGYAPIEVKDLTALHQAIAFYGGAYLGVALPESAQTQFQVGQESTWSVVPGSPIEGGHCIVAVGYSPTSLLCVSWGQLVEVTYPWWAAYGDEAWCVLSAEFIEAGKGPSLDLATLRSDLNLV